MSSQNESGPGLPMALQYHDNAILRQQFAQARPFRHVVIDEFLDPAVAEHIVDVLPTVGEPTWTIHGEEANNGSKKYSLTDLECMPAALKDVFDMFRSPAYLGWLSQLTEIGSLTPLGRMMSSGLHAVPRDSPPGMFDGFDQVDVNGKILYRRLDTFLYLNTIWDRLWGGQLKLWRGRERPVKFVKSIEPNFNRFAAVEYRKTRWYGHPEPLACPHDRHWISLTMHYFSSEAA